jgi:acyl-CoA synthetase (AMP-forming)/AMP-acid ligase II
MTDVRLLLSEAAEDWRASGAALKWGGRWYTYQELGRAVEKAAVTLWSKGVRPGDVVAQYAVRSADAVVNMYCPIPNSATPTEIVHYLRSAGVKAMLCDESRVRTVAHECHMLILSSYLADESTLVRSAPLPPTDTNLPAMLLFTSGSTGRPKGVLLSAANLFANAQQVADRTDLTVADRILHIMPLHHTNGINNNLVAPFLRGAQVVLTNGFRAETLLPLVASERPTYFTGVPTMYRRLLREPIPHGCFRSVRFVRCGSAPLSADLEADIEARFGVPVITSYGLTEGTCTSTMTPPGRARRGSVGLPLEGQDVRIVDPATGKPTPHGEIGEVVVRGPNVMIGYLGDPWATADAIRDGWLHTGDLGKFDEEGYLYLSGRLKDIIIRGGENISPREIEEVLLTHPEVLDAAVVGVPNTEYGEEPLAFVVGEAEEATLISYCRNRLSSFKIPRRIVRISELPRNSLGKVDQVTLRRWAETELR